MKFHKETEFQETEIGKIPKDWKVTKLGSISKIVSGYTFPLEMQGKAKGRYPFIKVNDMNSSYKYITNAENYVDEEDLPRLKARPFPEGTIIFPKIGMTMRLNKYRILGRDALFDNNIAGIIVDNKNVYNEYVYYYLQGKVNLLSLAGMTTVPSITKTKIEKLSIPLPPLNEQVKIAEILSKVDRTIELHHRGRERLERLRRGVMGELLTGSIRVREENGKLSFHREMEFQETEIGKIPRDWKVVKLGEVVEIWDKYRIPVKENERKPGPYPYCGANGIIGYIDGYTHDGEFVLLAEDGGFFGRFEKSAYIMCGKFWANNHVHVLKAIKGTIISEFLMHYLNFTDLTPFITGSTRPKLNQEAMKKIPIALPSLVEQMKIAEILSKVDGAIKNIDDAIARLERLKRGLMDLLLTGKVRVRGD
jgi:type I restriction enzyme S subunit